MKTIRSRLMLALGVVASMTLAMALVLYVGARRMDASALRTRQANDEVRDLLAFALVAHRYMNAFGASMGQRTLIANHSRRAAASAFESRITQMGPANGASSQLSREHWQQLREISNDLSAKLTTADELREKGKFNDGERVFEEARREEFDQRMLPWFDGTIETLRSKVGEREADSISYARQLRLAANAIGSLSVTLGLLAVIGVSRTVLRPIELLVDGTQALGRGDLSYRVHYDAKNELGVLASRFNIMADTVASAQSALIERNARLEEASQLQADFLSMMSHELRSPLHSIVGYTELVLEDERELGKQSFKNVGNIAVGAKRLLALINDILDFSRLKAGRMEACRRPFELGPLLEGVREDALALARGRAIAIVVEAPEERIVFEVDEPKLRQILTNLVSNAVKFTDQGVVRLQARVVENGMEFRVRDTGVGIPAEQLGNIFEPFRQVKRSGRPAIGGTGLGLAIVSRITALLGGHISVESEVGKGTQFVLFLPT